MEALKKAEQAKQDAAAVPGETALSLEPAETAEDKPDFPELDLAAGTSTMAAVPDERGAGGQTAPPPMPASPPALEITPPPPEKSAPAPLMELALEPPAPAEKPAQPPEPKAAEPAPPPAPKAQTRPTEPPPRPTQVAKRPEAAKQQARNVFSAKTGSAKPSFAPSKPIWAAIGLVVALLMAGTGYYFYRELNPPLQALQPGGPAPVPSAPAMVATPPSPPVAQLPQTAPPEAAPVPAAPSTPAPESPPKEQKAMAASDEALPERGDIRIQRGTPAETLNPNLTRAYQAMQAGNLNEAQDAYRKVLQADRNNRDALLGLAAIQERKGDADGAARLYQRLLALDPNDGAAQAGLTELGQGDPVRAESRLKSLLIQQPDSDALHFALGNLYAGQQRWSEAQQSYFRAFQKQPGNPDYLYNLAVSLDHLGQNKLAREYYRKALAAASHPHNFSPDEVQGRISALEQVAP